MLEIAFVGEFSDWDAATLSSYRGHVEKPTFTVVVCPDRAVAEAIEAAAPENFLPPIDEAMQSDDGRYAWSYWQTEPTFAADCLRLGATLYPYDDGQWKAAAGWKDKPVPPPTKET